MLKAESVTGRHSDHYVLLAIKAWQGKFRKDQDPHFTVLLHCLFPLFTHSSGTQTQVSPTLLLLFSQALEPSLLHVLAQCFLWLSLH